MILRRWYAVLLGCVYCVVPDSFAADEDELKLFHTPEKLPAVVSENIEHQSAERKTVEPLQKKQSIRYRYDGFIATATGTQYLINGRLLASNPSLTLLRSLQGGSVLELRSSAGNVFRVRIGETVIDKAS